MSSTLVHKAQPASKTFVCISTGSPHLKTFSRENFDNLVSSYPSQVKASGNSYIITPSSDSLYDILNDVDNNGNANPDVHYGDSLDDMGAEFFVGTVDTPDLIRFRMVRWKYQADGDESYSTFYVPVQARSKTLGGVVMRVLVARSF
jgi:hypothetical protein